MKENVKQFATKKKSGFVEFKKNLKIQNVCMLNTFEKQRLNLPLLISINQWKKSKVKF